MSVTVNFEHIPAELLAHQMLGVATCKAAGPLIENALREGWAIDAEKITCPGERCGALKTSSCRGRRPPRASAMSG
jgi:hypothetical protein